MLHELDYGCVYVLSHTFCHFTLSLPLFFFRSSSAVFPPDSNRAGVDCVALAMTATSCYTVILYLANMQKCHSEWQKKRNKQMTLLYNSIPFGFLFIGPVNVDVSMDSSVVCECVCVR